MTSLRNLLLGALGAIGGIAAIVLFATIGLAVIGGVVVAMVAGAVAMKLAPAHKHARGVRRDARGIIIDM